MGDCLIEDFKVKLEVPYSDLNTIKKLGAKPYYRDGVFDCWFVPAGTDLYPFRRWWSGSYRYRFNIKNGYVHSLTDYLKFVKSVVSDSLSRCEWIIGSINDISGNKHHYLDLSDHDSEGVELSKSKAVIFHSDRHILSKFKKETGIELAPNQKVMLLVSVNFDEKYGVSLVVKDINPSYTIGDMEAKVQRIRAKLITEGLYDRNKKMIMPDDFYRVAVIAPQNAAGLGDFKKISDVIEKNGLVTFDYFTAVFQGDSLIPTFTDAFSAIRNSKEKFDVIVIIRGGGDKAGIHCLNEYELAVLLAKSDVPVICGIGHQKDRTILDDVSHTSLATPSMVISFIKDVIIGYCAEIESAQQQITFYLDALLDKVEREAEIVNFEIFSLLESVVGIVESDVKLLLSEIEGATDNLLSELSRECTTLSVSIFEIVDSSLRIFDSKRKEVFQSIVVNDPKLIFDKGFSILKDDSGTTVSSAANLKDGFYTVIFNKEHVGVNLKVKK